MITLWGLKGIIFSDIIENLKELNYSVKEISRMSEKLDKLGNLDELNWASDSSSINKILEQLYSFNKNSATSAIVSEIKSVNDEVESLKSSIYRLELELGSIVTEIKENNHLTRRLIDSFENRR